MAALMSLMVVTGGLLHSLERFWLMPQARVDVLLEHTTAALSLWGGSFALHLSQTTLEGRSQMIQAL